MSARGARGVASEFGNEPGVMVPSGVLGVVFFEMRAGGSEREGLSFFPKRMNTQTLLGKLAFERKSCTLGKNLTPNGPRRPQYQL